MFWNPGFGYSFDFEARLNGTELKLVWTQHHLEGVSSFVLEKSDDGVNFEVIANGRSAGTALKLEQSLFDPDFDKLSVDVRIKQILKKVTNK